MTTADPTLATINEVRKYLGMTMAEFKEEWPELDADSKIELRRLTKIEIG